MYEYRIITAQGVIVQILTGDILLKDLENLYYEIINDPLFSRDYSFVGDFRQAVITLSLDEIATVVDFIISHNISKGKTAILINRSLDTAKLMLIGEQLNPHYLLSVFSTIDAASSFLNIQLNNLLDVDYNFREDLYAQ